MLLVVAGVDVVHQLCKAGVRGSIPLVSTGFTSGNLYAVLTPSVLH